MLFLFTLFFLKICYFSSIPVDSVTSLFVTGGVYLVQPIDTNTFVELFQNQLEYDSFQALVTINSISFISNFTINIYIESLSKTNFTFVALLDQNFCQKIGIKYLIKNPIWTDFNIVMMIMDDLIMRAGDSIMTGTYVNISYQYPYSDIQHIVLNGIDFTNNHPFDSQLWITYNNDKLNRRFFLYGDGDLVINNFTITLVWWENLSPILIEIKNLSEVNYVINKIPDTYQKHSIAFWIGLIVGNNTPSFDIVISNFKTEVNSARSLKITDLWILVPLCTNLAYRYLMQDQGVCYDICPDKYFANNYICQQCPQSCSTCSNYILCSSCSLGYSLNDQGLCSLNTCQTDPSLCNNKIQIIPICFFSELNKNKKRCETLGQIQTAANVLKGVKSIPTLSIFTTVFVNLFNTFQDIAYYPYHQRNYSTNVVIFFNMMSDFKATRFFPSFLSTFYQSIDFTIQTKNNNKIPQKFIQIDDTIEFLKTTQDFWTGTVPLSFLIFSIMFLIDKIINKFYQTKILKKFRYPVLILFDLWCGNVQYFFFAFGKQLFQTTIFQTIKIFALISAFITALITLLLSISLHTLISLQMKLSQEKTVKQIFNQNHKNWIISFNIISAVLGIIHSLFYYYKTLQSLLLFVVFFSKLIIYILIHRKQFNTLQFCFQVISMAQMILIQSFFMIQNILIDKQAFTLQLSIQMGNFQSIFILLLLLTRIFQTFYLLIKSTFSIIKKNNKKQQNIQKQKRRRNRNRNFVIIKNKDEHKSQKLNQQIIIRNQQKQLKVLKTKR